MNTKKVLMATLAIALLMGTAYAAYISVYTYTSIVTAKEPIEVFTATSEWTNPGPPAEMYAGDFYVGSWLIHNKGSDVAFPVTITVRISKSAYTRSAITIGYSDDVGSLGRHFTYTSTGDLLQDADMHAAIFIDRTETSGYIDYSFKIGTYDYTKAESTSGTAFDVSGNVDGKGMTSYIKLLTGFGVESDAPLDATIEWTITVFRS